MDKKTQLYVLEDISKVRARFIDPEGLDKLEIPELEFAVSPHDLLHNVIEVKRAKRAAEWSNIGQPRHRDIRIDEVSELASMLL